MFVYFYAGCRIFYCFVFPFKHSRCFCLDYKKTHILRVYQKIRSLSEIGRVIEAARAAANQGTNYTRFMDHHSPTFAIHSPLMNPR